MKSFWPVYLASSCIEIRPKSREPLKPTSDDSTHHSPANFHGRHCPNAAPMPWGTSQIRYTRTHPKSPKDRCGSGRAFSEQDQCRVFSKTGRPIVTKIALALVVWHFFRSHRMSCIRGMARNCDLVLLPPFYLFGFWITKTNKRVPRFPPLLHRCGCVL